MSSTPTPVEHPTSSAREHTKWGFSILFGVVGSLIVGLVVLAFLWPVATASPKDLPIAIAGPSAQATALEKAINASASGAIDFHAATDRDAAIAQIKNCSVYGAIVLGSQPEVLTASAGSPVVTPLL